MDKKISFASPALLKKITLLTALLLFALQLYHVFSWPVWRDDAFFANVAKNLALGQGYKAVIFDKNYLFHYGITSGPLIILPAALMLVLFGNSYWVPGLTAVLLIGSLLAAIFIAAGFFLGKEKKWTFCFLFLWFALLFTIGDNYNYGIETGDRLAIWCLLLGEIPASCCVIVSALILLRPDPSWKRIFWGAFIMGIAVTTKALTAIAAAVILTALASTLFASRRYKLIAICALGIATPIAAFEIAKLLFMGWPAYQEMQTGNAQFYTYFGAPHAAKSYNETNPPLAVMARVMVSLSSLGIFVLFPLYLLYVKKIANKLKNIVNTKSYNIARAGLMLIGCFCIHMTWWLFLSMHVDRHMVSAFFYLAAGIALFLSSVNYISTERKFQFKCLIAIIALWHVSAIHYLIFDSLKTSGSLQPQLTLAHTLTDFEKKKVTLFSCGFDSELEYLMPGTDHFKPCSDLTRLDQPPGPKMLVNYFIEPKRILVQDAFYGRIVSVPLFARALCDKQFLETRTASLLWCNDRSENHQGIP